MNRRICLDANTLVKGQGKLGKKKCLFKYFQMQRQLCVAKIKSQAMKAKIKKVDANEICGA